LIDPGLAVSERENAVAEEVEVVFEFSFGGGDGFEEFGVVEIEVGLFAEFDAGDLGGVHFDCSHVTGTGGEEGERVVAGGSDGEAASPFAHTERFDEDVCVFPALAIADLGKIGASLDFSFHP
jgi:hypothetical protein